MSEKTIFEKIIAKEVPAQIVLENDDLIVINDVNPQAPIHVLIIPKKRIARISESDEHDIILLGKLILAAKNFAKQKHLTSFRLVINDGVQAGQTVPHLHIHLLAGRPMTWPPG